MFLDLFAIPLSAMTAVAPAPTCQVAAPQEAKQGWHVKHHCELMNRVSVGVALMGMLVAKYGQSDNFQHRAAPVLKDMGRAQAAMKVWGADVKNLQSFLHANRSAYDFFTSLSKLDLATKTQRWI